MQDEPHQKQRQVDRLSWIVEWRAAGSDGFQANRSSYLLEIHQEKSSYDDIREHRPSYQH